MPVRGTGVDEAGSVLPTFAPALRSLQIFRPQQGFDVRHHTVARQAEQLVAAGDPEPELALDLQGGGVIRKYAGMDFGFGHSADKSIQQDTGGFGHEALSPIEPV